VLNNHSNDLKSHCTFPFHHCNFGGVPAKKAPGPGICGSSARSSQLAITSDQA
jgi:hypothetical protein